MEKTRFDALSDGIIAIIITIMVLEMKTPHEATWAALSHILPIFISYILSFVFVGIYWANHHHLMHTLPKVNSKVIWANFSLLFFLSLIPFTTGWLGETHFEKIPVFVYSLNLILTAISYFALQQIVMKSWKHESKMEVALKKQESKGMLSLVLYIFALASALYQPLISLVVFVVVGVMWIIPDRNIEKALKEN